MLKTINTETISDQISQTSNPNSPIKLIRRSSRSNSLKIQRSQSKSSFEQSFPIFFIKKVPKLLSKQSEQQQQTADVTPVKAFSRRIDQQSITQRKRQPTPSKSLKELRITDRRQQKTQTSQINLEKEMQIHQLQKKLATQSKIRLIYEQRSKQFQNQVSNQIKKLRSVEKQLELSKERESNLQIKVTELQGQLESRNNDLKNTRSNLEKLKQNIAEVRAQQYQAEVKRATQQITKLKEINQQQQKQITILKNEITSLKIQINHIKSISQQNKLKAQQQSKSYLLKSQIENLKKKLSTSSTEKQKFLEHKIAELHLEIDKLIKINQSKVIQIDFLARKKHQEFQMLKTRKGQEIKTLRTKFASLMDQYKYLKNQKNHLKSKDKKDSLLKSIQKKQIQKRQNRFACSTNPTIKDEDFLCFSLSPQLK